jgi:hypothetical protein
MPSFLLFLARRTVMTRADLTELEQRLLEVQQTRDQLKQKVAARQASTKRLISVRACIEEIQLQTEEDEQQQIEEFGQAASELNTLRHPDLSKRLLTPSDLPKYEADLAGLTERSQRQAQLLADLHASDAVNAANLSALIEKNQEMKQRYRILEKYKVRLPLPVPMVLQIHDLEAVKCELAGAVQRGLTVEIPTLKAKIEAKGSKNHLKLAELRRIAADCDAAEHEIIGTKTATAATSSRLEGLSSELQAIHLAMKSEIDRSSAERVAIEKVRDELKREAVKGPEKVAQAKKELEDLPNRARTNDDNKATLLVKRKALLVQLQKKFEEARQDLVRRQASLPVVIALTKTLEKEWMEHQKLLDALHKAETQKRAVENDIARIELVLVEVQTRWPFKTKRSGKNGLAELCSIFEEAMIQNRQMGIDHVVLKDEVSALEEINASFKANLVRDSVPR